MSTVVLEHSDSTGAERLGIALRDHGHRLRVVRPDRGEPIPVDLDDVDAIVACGGPQSSIDDGVDWIGAEMAFLRSAHEASIPVVGICLGSQILARALGGTVAPVTGHRQCGWNEIILTPAGREDPIFGGQKWRSRQVTWHQHHVTDVPTGARVLARSEAVPVQAWAVGLRTYAFQYHPEVGPATIAGWADQEPHALDEAGLTRGHLDEETVREYPAFARLSDRLFQTIALLLMPLDRRFAGIAKDLHH